MDPSKNTDTGDTNVINASAHISPRISMVGDRTLSINGKLNYTKFIDHISGLGKLG